MWPLEYLDMLYHRGPGVLLFAMTLVAIVGVAFAKFLKDELRERRMKKYLGRSWKDHADSKLRQYDQKLADLLFELNKEREEQQRPGISDYNRMCASENFQVCMKKIGRWRKERDIAYSLAFRVGHGEAAEARIRKGLPIANQLRDLCDQQPSVA